MRTAPSRPFDTSTALLTAQRVDAARRAHVRRLDAEELARARDARAFQVPAPPVMLRRLSLVKSSNPPPTSRPVPSRPTQVWNGVETAPWW